MKAVQQELARHLSGDKHFLSCDLYALRLRNGQDVYFCEYDEDVIYNNHRYLHDTCIAIRTNTEIGHQLTVDKLSLTLYADDADTIGNTNLIMMARNGGFDGAALECSRAFMDDEGNIIGVIPLFSGLLEVRNGGGMAIKFDVKSKIQLLNVEWPNRRYYPTCAFSLYSKSCGVQKEQYRVNASVISNGTNATFTINVHKPNGYFNNGAVHFMSGPLVGRTCTILSNTGNYIKLLVSEEDAPKAGDIVALYPGCDKTLKMCDERFGGGNKNRSTPYVPLKETIR